MIAAALAILETDAQRRELSEIYESNIKATPYKDHFWDLVRILLAYFPSYRPKTP